MIARLSAWWSAWKYVAVLALLLVGSLWLNLHQYVAGKTAPLREDLKQATEALDTINAIGRAAQEDGAETQKRLGDIAAQSEQALKRYANAAKSKPLPPQCAPGQERVDAINAGLGPQK